MFACASVFHKARQAWGKKKKEKQAGMKDENVREFPFFKCDVITSLN